ncbi:hypothetical protein PHYBLDRAFT_59376 [Phycomyces blakesleeanus NRRL 1555(-)]|uniref:Uncharacterized protein n=1 Tax=Phycomyces blakesleeanus (strain ATCC 8743b / DSM 1359 / FGSC 10004 / NBRC 33097 / NRRL 1555) TaxID=763407 RepID=A0A162PZS5_PHYB8|nr:hypothetical protein PHYBLDRAFT_59376 [Phycomyces blakesleeanus NRRL 1555(-)]OAD75846.1 hypothetical protein PHYBLDRAFT_59376 [Phycomyces blakesleeanus NRRL 1555(-)]|eukprot:XP_018293886.1 hypothetical protein PHYBLDRAFT_59376 [Phycomyces blakesleeanus NRRL 1555(-)]
MNDKEGITTSNSFLKMRNAYCNIMLGRIKVQATYINNIFSTGIRSGLLGGYCETSKPCSFLNLPATLDVWALFFTVLYQARRLVICALVTKKCNHGFVRNSGSLISIKFKTKDFYLLSHLKAHCKDHDSSLTHTLVKNILWAKYLKKGLDDYKISLKAIYDSTFDS